MQLRLWIYVIISSLFFSLFKGPALADPIDITTTRATCPSLFLELLPTVSADLTNWGQQARTGCQLEGTEFHSPSDLTDSVCQCLSSKDPQTKFKYKTLAPANKNQMQNAYLKSTGKLFKSMLYTTFEDLLNFDVRVKKGAGLNQNFLMYAPNCRLGAMKDNLNALRRDPQCNLHILNSRVKMILGTDSVDAFFTDLQSKLSQVTSNQIPSQYSGQNFCMSYKQFLGVKEPSRVYFENYQRIKELSSTFPSPLSSENREIVRQSLLNSPEFQFNNYNLNTDFSYDYFRHVFDDTGGTDSELRADFKSFRHTDFRTNDLRSQSTLSRLILSNPAFVDEINGSTNAVEFMFSSQANRKVLESLNSKCEKFSNRDNLRELFCRHTYPNNDINTLTQNVGPSLYAQDRNIFGNRVNEYLASHFLCKPEVDSETGAVNFTPKSELRTRNAPTAKVWDELLAPNQNVVTELESIATQTDLAGQKTSYEQFNKSFCSIISSLSNPSLTGSNGRFTPSSLNIDAIKRIILQYARSNPKLRSQLTHIQGPVFSKLETLFVNARRGQSDDNEWHALGEELKKIMGNENTTAFINIIHATARRRARTDYALNEFLKGRHPNASNPLQTEIDRIRGQNPNLTYEQAYAQVLETTRTSAPAGSTVHRIVNGSSSDGTSTETGGTGSSIFSDYFVSGSSSDQSALTTFRAGLSPSQESSLTSTSWTPGQSGAGTKGVTPPPAIPYQRSFDPTPSTSQPIANNSDTPVVDNSSKSPSVAPVVQAPVSNLAANGGGPVVTPAITSPRTASPIVSPVVATNTNSGPRIVQTSQGNGGSNDGNLTNPVNPTNPQAEPVAPNGMPRLARTSTFQNGANPNGPGVNGPTRFRSPASFSSGGNQDDSDTAVGSLGRNPYNYGDRFQRELVSKNLEDINLAGGRGKKLTPEELKRLQSGQRSALSSGLTPGAPGGKSGAKLTGGGFDPVDRVLNSYGSLSPKDLKAKKKKLEKVRKARSFFSYEERLLIPHSIIESQKYDKGNDQSLFQMIALLGLEGKRWSTISVEYQGEVPTFIINTYDIVYKGNDPKKAKNFQTSTFRDMLSQEVTALRILKRRGQLAKISNYTRQVGQVKFNQQEFEQYKKYLANEGQILRRVRKISLGVVTK